MTWRTIRSVPKDGRSFIGLHDDYGNANCEIMKWDGCEKCGQGVIVSASDEGMELAPTHWMELPELPRGVKQGRIAGDHFAECECGIFEVKAFRIPKRKDPPKGTKKRLPNTLAATSPMFELEPSQSVLYDGMTVYAGTMPFPYPADA